MARFAASLLSAVLVLAACHESPRPEPLVNWTVTAERSWTRDGASADALTHCDTAGNNCQNLTAGQSVLSPATLFTTDRSRAAVRLDPTTELELAERARVYIPVAPVRTLAIERGRVTLTHGTNGESYWLRFAGFSTRVDTDQNVVASIAAAGPDAATLTLHRGELVVMRGLDYTRVRSGQTVQLAGGKTPDFRAAYTGRVTPVARIRTNEPPAETRIDHPRGLGRVSARIPGTERVVAGVRLSKHHVDTVITDGYARTEVEEELFNDTDRVLEGHYQFALPPGASLSRLALWVGDELIEGELVERKRAARIFKGIVDDTVRPRDPALLEWVSGRELSLKIFPIEPRKGRRVVIAYNEALPTEASSIRYRYPLDLGRDRATKIDDFTLRVRARDQRGPIAAVSTTYPTARVERGEPDTTVVFEARQFVPLSDFVVEYGVGENRAPLSLYWPGAGDGELPEIAEIGDSGYFALQLTAELPDTTPVPKRTASERVIVIDRSFSQGEASLRAELQVTQALLDDLGDDDRFAVLVCDTDCETYPEHGMATPSAGSTADVETWLGRVAQPQGASNLAGSLVAAARRVDPDRGGQVVYLGDGRATAGELSTASIATRAGPTIRQHRIDLRLLGVGRTVDDVMLRGLAAAVGATYDIVASGESLERRLDALTLALRTPVVESPQLELPATFTDVLPRQLPNLRLGQSVLVTGKLKGPGSGELNLCGTLAGTPYALTRTLSAAQDRPSNPLVPRLWAEQKIAGLQKYDDMQSQRAVVELSQQHHVASRHTSLLVLESERMFAEFGIARTQRQTSSDRASATWGAEIGESRGGLGLSGLGEGGGGRGEGIGLGNIGAVGHGAAAPQGGGFGWGHGRLGGSHKTQAPRVRMGATTVNGRLPPEVIQRIVRQNYGRFRLCYEQGLARQPDLGGRVVARFVISRDGRVTHAAQGGGDLPDSSVVACVVRSFYGLSFPAPEGGIVTVTYPIVFSVGGTSSYLPRVATSRRLPVPSPRVALSQRVRVPSTRVSHHPGSDAWRELGASQITAAKQSVTEHPQSRNAHQKLVSTLLRLGRFAEAGNAAGELVRLDPDNSFAHEAIAAAAATQGDGERAAHALASALELGHHSSRSQMRVARAFETIGDERRACAHWRAAVELAPNQTRAQLQAIRCQARAGEFGAALTELGSLEAPDFTELADQIRRRHVLPYDPRRDTPGWFEVRLDCESAAKSCPVPLVLTPLGRLVSPWSPEAARATPTRLALTRRTAGRYRTLLVGGDPGTHGKLTLVVDGATHTRFFAHDGHVTTAVESDVL